MNFWRTIRRSNFVIRLSSWEYWPFGIVQFPAIIYWLWLSLRARSLVFFSAANPGIPMGGMFGESKYDILQKIPLQYIPVTIKIESVSSVDSIIAVIRKAGLQLPVIFKPDIGERGYQVKRINCADEIPGYLRAIRGPFLIQELIEEPLEFGVFYLRFPGDVKGAVISLVGKEMLSVTGDGTSTLLQLIMKNDRAKLQLDVLKTVFQAELGSVVETGKRLELVSIGNHARGTRFINASHLINEPLSRTFDVISANIPGFYFGRFDLRCASLDALYEGRVKILELNGCGAEPAHIYDKEFTLWKAFHELIRHWDNIFQIALANKARGVEFVTLRDGLEFYRRFKDAVK